MILSAFRGGDAIRGPRATVSEEGGITETSRPSPGRERAFKLAKWLRLASATSWDEDKARSNLEKHGVSFEEASSVFLDPYFLATDDSSAPDRFIALGFSRLARLLFVVHLERGEKVRIISARRASRAERKSDEQRRNDPG